MANGFFDAELTFVSSPLRLILFVCGHLVTQGYGALRLCSYVKEGIGELRVKLYCEMAERGRNDERLAHDAFWSCSFRSFQRSDTEAALNDWAKLGWSVARAAKEFARIHIRELDGCRGFPDPLYLQWYAGLIRICKDDGFPITEEPEVPGYGPHEDMVKILYARTAQERTFYPRAPGFADTVFPYAETTVRAATELAERERARVASHYAEWKRRVAEIDRRRRT